MRCGGEPPIRRISLRGVLHVLPPSCDSHCEIVNIAGGLLLCVRRWVISLPPSSSTVCGSQRTVYFRLPTEDMQLSEEALIFINSIMSILPYSVRKRLSFVTYVSDTESYKGFNLKCISRDVESVDSREGSFYDFERGMVTGQPI